MNGDDLQRGLKEADISELFDTVCSMSHPPARLLRPYNP
jgi:hypothetical protein